MKNLVFDIWADFGHYKQIYMSTSALSYPIPFKTAIYGLIGSIIGLSKDQYLDFFQMIDGKPVCELSLQILTKLRKLRIPENLLSEPGQRIKEHKPTNMDFVYKPKYRIFFRHSNPEIYDQLKERLINHSSVYTPVLGLANMIANFNFVGEFESILKTDDGEFVDISTIIPQSSFIEFNPEEIFYQKNKIVTVTQYAVEMNPDRHVIKRDSIIFDEVGFPVSCRVKQFESINIDGVLLNACFI